MLWIKHSLLQSSCEDSWVGDVVASHLHSKSFTDTWSHRKYNHRKIICLATNRPPQTKIGVVNLNRPYNLKLFCHELTEQQDAGNIYYMLPKWKRLLPMYVCKYVINYNHREIRLLFTVYCQERVWRTATVII